MGTINQKEKEIKRNFIIITQNIFINNRKAYYTKKTTIKKESFIIKKLYKKRLTYYYETLTKKDKNFIIYNWIEFDSIHHFKIYILLLYLTHTYTHFIPWK